MHLSNKNQNSVILWTSIFAAEEKGIGRHYQACVMEPLAVNYFCKKVPSQIFHRVLNTPLLSLSFIILNLFLNFSKIALHYSDELYFIDLLL